MLKARENIIKKRELTIKMYQDKLVNVIFSILKNINIDMAELVKQIKNEV